MQINMRLYTLQFGTNINFNKNTQYWQRYKGMSTLEHY